MRSIRNLIYLAAGGALAAFLAYDLLLREFVGQVPRHVFELAAWTWALWAGWYLLQKISR